MCYLDCIVTGADMKYSGLQISNIDMTIIQNLMNDFLGKPTTNKFDDYIYSTFKCFCQHKKQIVLDFHQLEHADNKIRDLMIYSLDGVAIYTGDREKKRDISDYVNVFRLAIFKIFKNAKTVVIITTDSLGASSYSFSLSLLLSLIEAASLDKVIVKAVTYEHYSGKNWIYSLWKSSSKTIKEEYDGKNYKISIKKVKNTFGRKGHWFVINKRH